MDIASTRLRKTFHYPTDDDSSYAPSTSLDEEEQENLISDLQTRNAHSNELFKHYFLALPTLSTIPYISLLFTPTTPQKLLALLSITSLACTTYLLYALPPDQLGIDFIDGMRNAGLRKGRVQGGDTRGPVLRYLPFLNVALAGIVLVLGMIKGNRFVDQQHTEILNYLPLAIYLFTLLVKFVMGGVDVGELAELKYNYKGA